MIHRIGQIKVESLLQGFPCVAIIGPRQVGKTTLAKQIRKLYPNAVYLDMELQSDFLKLEDAETYLAQFEDRLIIIDEVQRRKELFPVLRALIDANRRPGRFLLLGSASPDLIRDSSESLAGRIAYFELSPFLIQEVKSGFSVEDLWFRGGFPDPFLHPEIWTDWMNNFINTYFDRDLPNLGFPADSTTGRRLWLMLAHLHGNLIRYSDLAKSLELSIHTIKKYISFLENAFLIRTVKPYYSNIRKRLVKAPKVYIRDSGILHFLLGINTREELMGNPKMGASWEGFVLEQLLPLFPLNREIFFYRTHDGAELDVVITKGGIPDVGVEIKYGSDVRLSRGNTQAIEALNTKHNFVLVKNEEDYLLKSGTRVCGLLTFIEKYLPEI
ncbi:MAG: ATP-binding protein [Bacteroidales bacterium]|nr:ATP-binding protein [Bacteroidales bacterium]